MDLKLIRNLVRIMERGEVTELEVADDPSGLRVHLKRGAAGAPPGGQVVMMPGAAAAPPADAGAAPDVAPSESASDSGLPAGVDQVVSPMVGTFYRSPSPEADSFVKVGDRVDADTVVCIVEAMKVMNEINAELNGEVVDILVSNGEPVEFGQPLFLVKTN